MQKLQILLSRLVLTHAYNYRQTRYVAMSDTQSVKHRHLLGQSFSKNQHETINKWTHGPDHHVVFFIKELHGTDSFMSY